LASSSRDGWCTATARSSSPPRLAAEGAPRLGAARVRQAGAPERAAFAIVALITWLLVIGVKESTRVNNVMVGIKLLVLAVFVTVACSTST